MNTKFKLAGTVAGCVFITSLATNALALSERGLTDKTGHIYLSNVSEATIDSKVAKGFRMFDIEVVSTYPNRYTASFVKNSGPYATSWWWRANKTEAEMNAFLTQRQARIIDIETYFVKGKRLYAFVAVPNPSIEHKDWWWFAGKTWNEMNNLVQARNGRLLDVDVEVIKGKRRFSGVLIRNQGQDYKNWKVFSNISSKQIRDLLSGGPRGERNKRLVDLERLGTDRFAGIMEDGEGQDWWWFTNQTWSDVQRMQGQFASRVIDIERNVQGKKTRFDILLIDNSNALESRIGKLLRSSTDGTTGFMLKEVNGSTVGSILPDFRTYPSSTNKVLQHYYWSSRIGEDVSSDTVVPIYSNHTQDSHTQQDISQYLSLRQTSRFMMWNSGNTSSNALQDFAGGGNGVTGRANINNFGWNVLGLTDDFEFHHKYADGNVGNDPFSIFSMRQVTKLYEAFGNSVALTDEQWGWMYDNMKNTLTPADLTNGKSFFSGVKSVLNQEGAALGMDQNDIDNLYFNILMVQKDGGVSGYSSSAGWIRLTYKTNNGADTKEFAVGAFADNFNSLSVGLSGTVLPEILRDELAAMLETWK